MKTAFKLTAVGSLAMGLMMLNPVTASASLVYDSSILLSAQGFGSANRDLTVQGNGTESACVSVTAAQTFAAGPTSCDAGTAAGNNDAMFGPNGVINQGGQEVNPTTDAAKYGVPYEDSLGINNSAANIGILFNATEPNGDSINITDITLKFYNNGVLIGSIDGSFNFVNGTNPGNGVAGFAFVVDAAQTAYVNGLLAQGNIQFALETTIEGAAGGPESFRVVNLGTSQRVPDGGATLLLLGAALSGLAAVRRFTKS